MIYVLLNWLCKIDIPNGFMSCGPNLEVSSPQHGVHILTPSRLRQDPHQLIHPRDASSANGGGTS
eukprot:6484314-Amphidinium_carterae.1